MGHTVQYMFFLMFWDANIALHQADLFEKYKQLISKDDKMADVRRMMIKGGDSQTIHFITVCAVCLKYTFVKLCSVRSVQP